jgi:cysteine desulfurase
MLAAALCAANARLRESAAAHSVWRDELEADISRVAPGAVFLPGARLPNTSCFALPGIEAHVLLIALDMRVLRYRRVRPVRRER